MLSLRDVGPAMLIIEVDGHYDSFLMRVLRAVKCTAEKHEVHGR